MSFDLALRTFPQAKGHIGITLTIQGHQIHLDCMAVTIAEETIRLSLDPDLSLSPPSFSLIASDQFRFRVRYQSIGVVIDSIEGLEPFFRNCCQAPQHVAQAIAHSFVKSRQGNI